MRDTKRVNEYVAWENDSDEEEDGFYKKNRRQVLHRVALMRGRQIDVDLCLDLSVRRERDDFDKFVRVTCDRISMHKPF